MEVKEKTQLSCDVSKALDAMKYGYYDIQARVQIYQIFQDLWNKSEDDDELSYIIAGSRAEGVSHAEEPENDFDLMGEFNPLICCDDLHKSGPHPGKVVLEMVAEHTAPGYTMLRCKNSDNEEITSLRSIFTQKCNGQRFVGHSLSVYTENGFVANTVSGPAYSKQFSLQSGSSDEDSDSEIENVSISPHCLCISSSSNNGKNSSSKVPCFSADYVFAIPCLCTEYLQMWKHRVRFTSWPGQQLIEEVSKMNGHVVPVGNKGSDNGHLEWRMCYTETEIKLIHSMNETQLKLYVLLKMVAKKKLKHICSDISFYIIKNVLFWFVEKTPADRFKPENLMNLMEDALQTLHKSIEKEFLSNYIIPERNLLAGRLSKDVKRKLLAELQNLIHVQGPKFFLHHKDFQSPKASVEQIKQCGTEESHAAAEGSQQSQNLDPRLQRAYEKADDDIENYLDTIISTLSPEQIKQNISDIIFLATNM